jgi:serine/threonine protein kinase
MNAPTSLHPSDQTLSSYGLGKLDDESAEAVDKHLEECPDCTKWVAEMSADSFLGRVRDVRAGKSTFDKSQTGGTQSDSRSSAPPPIGTMPPELAEHPDYEIKRELGRGGMGVVYLAHNKLMGRDEVLKVMGRQVMERPGVLDRFLREIRAVAKLRHPNIVTAYHATRLGESIVFAMEYVEGLDLSKMIKAKGQLPVAHACNFVYQSALGLQHAHDEGLVHRDIKPGNLMLSRKGNKATIKVLDFGLAKVTREEKVDLRLTSEGQALGTPDYIAPEQIIDAPSADIRADIYSLGGTLFHLLAGRPPFQANSLYDMFQAHMSREADALNFVRPEVPAELAALVARMMAKDPARRFQTPGEVAEALTPFFKKGNAAFKGTKPEFARDGQMAASRPETGAVSTPTERATDAGRPVARAKKPSEAAVPEPQWESLIAFRETERSVDEAPKVESTRRPPWKRWPIALAGFLFGLIALGVIIITIRDKNGRETKISVSDDSTVVYEGPRKNIKLKPPVNGQEATGVPSGPTSVPREAGRPLVDKLQGPPTDHVDASEFAPIFNGKDLSGWTFPTGSETDWTVENGSIRGAATTGGSTIATSRSDYEDFHLRMEVRTTENLCKNLLIRASHSDGQVKYYVFWTGGSKWDGVASLGEYRFKRGGDKMDSSQVTTDGLREITAPKLPGLAKDTWQRVEIIAVGNEFRMLVDGREVSAFQDTELRLKRGQVAIRLPERAHVEIRKMEIKELTGKGVVGNETRQSHFVPLFNGKDKTGWASPRNKGEWNVVDGVLEGNSQQERSVLHSEREDFTNFRLHLKFRYQQEGLGSIIIRSSAVGENGENAYGIRQGSWPINDEEQIPVGSIAKWKNFRGQLHTWEKLAAAHPVPINTWNTMDITAVKGRIITSVNGKEVADYTDASGWFGSGGISLRVWGGTVVQFQDITIEELPE